MKKIGILTFHRSKNYGAFLQCYALYKALEELCPDCKIEVIDFTRKYVENSYRNFQIKNCIRHPRFLISTIRKNRMFEEFLKYLPLSKRKVVDNGVEKFIQAYKNEYDVVIVGSDVVWGVNEAYFPMPYWLEGLNAKKMSYAAASHGTDYEHLSQEARRYCSKMLEEFAYIGTRDLPTQEFVQNMVPDQTVFHNCDPTVLLNMQDVLCDMQKLKQKLHSMKGFDASRKTIGVMLSDPYMTKQIMNNFGDKCNIVAVYTTNPQIPMNLMNLDIFEWANVFSLFDLTITTFFHGTLFSLKNGTPVISLNLKERDERYIGKTEDILTRFGMRDRFFHVSSLKEDCTAFVNTANRLLEVKSQEYIFQRLEDEKKSFLSFADSLRQQLM